MNSPDIWPRSGDSIDVADFDSVASGVVVRASASSYDVAIDGRIWRFWSVPASFAVARFIRPADA